MCKSYLCKPLIQFQK